MSKRHINEDLQASKKKNADLSFDEDWFCDKCLNVIPDQEIKKSVSGFWYCPDCGNLLDEKQQSKTVCASIKKMRTLYRRLRYKWLSCLKKLIDRIHWIIFLKYYNYREEHKRTLWSLPEDTPEDIADRQADAMEAHPDNAYNPEKDDY